MGRIISLFVILLIHSLWLYKFSSRRLLSPSLLVSAVFDVFAMLYVLNYDFMNRDISKTQFFIVLFFMFFMDLGELCANRLPRVILLKHKKISIKGLSVFESISFSKNKTYFIFVIMVFVALIRYISLARYAGTLFSKVNFFTIIGAVRRNGKYVNDTGKIISAMVYIGFFLACIYAFYFVYSYVRLHEKKLYLLLPVAGYMLMDMTSTNRNMMIQMGTCFVVSYLVCLSLGKTKAERRMNIAKLIVSLVCLLVIFFAYGNLTRSQERRSIAEVRANIVAYSASAMYCMDDYLMYPSVYSNYYEGAYYSQYIESFLGNKDRIISIQIYPWRQSGSVSNIFTGFFNLMYDFGFWGTVVSGFVFSFCCVMIERALMNTKFMSFKYYIFIFILMIYIYCLIMLPISDAFPSIFLNPSYLLKISFGVVAAYLIMILGRGKVWEG